MKQDLHMKFAIYGIPSCSTVAKARAWFAKRDIDVAFVNFRETEIAPATVAAWVKRLGAHAMRNTSGGSYRALPAEKSTWDDAEWIKRFAQDPMLIKRPIIERDGQAVLVGFRGTDDVIAQLVGLSPT